MANPAAFSEALHMALAAYVAIGFAVAGIHAYVLLRRPGHPLHRRALAIALTVGGACALLQPLSGDLSARQVARHQPAKLAAMEAVFHTRRGAPLTVGGWPDEESRTLRFGLEIPYGLSLMAFHDPRAEVKGLDAVPRADWPPVAVVHVAFQVMVGCGTVLAALALLGAVLAGRRRRVPDQRWFLKALVLAAPLGLLALEAGWTVTEVGRQPWIVHGVLRTADAVTPMPGLPVPLVAFTALYLMLGAVVVVLLRRQVFKSRGPAPPAPARAHA
jgi:cytochrome d ubiquinol oxidase subunit I